MAAAENQPLPGEDVATILDGIVMLLDVLQSLGDKRLNVSELDRAKAIVINQLVAIKQSVPASGDEQTPVDA